MNARCTRVQGAVRAGQRLHRGDLGAVELRGEHQARAGGLAVDQHGAGAARALLAAGVGAGEGQLVAQEVQQQVRGSTSTSCAVPFTVTAMRILSGIPFLRA